MTILHARVIGTDAITGSMHHAWHDNLVEFKIYEMIRNFCTDDIIYVYYSYDQLITTTTNDSVVNHVLPFNWMKPSLWFVKDHSFLSVSDRFWTLCVNTYATMSRQSYGSWPGNRLFLISDQLGLVVVVMNKSDRKLCYKKDCVEDHLILLLGWNYVPNVYRILCGSIEY